MLPDAWQSLRSRTAARIALGRAGGSLPTHQCLAFAADHADARDAVYSELDVPAFGRSLGLPIVALTSQATDRRMYLQRPDLGRRLDVASVDRLQALSADPVNVALIVADGLSATAAQRHAVDVIRHLVQRFNHSRFTIGPLCVVCQARVAIQDEIGSLLRAKIAIILIGERPGLGLADSLGAYLVYEPRVGKTDADRNCVSNIHPAHLPTRMATETLVWLVEQALVRQLSGVNLKDERNPTAHSNFEADVKSDNRIV